MGKIDLHVHTTASDGSLTPTQAVCEAARNGVYLLGIADHDCTDGVREAEQAGRSNGITVIPAVELSVGSGPREIHVLGYYLEVEQAELQDALALLRDARDTRNDRIVQRLRELGAPIDLERVKEIGGDGSVGRPHIAYALVEAGHVSSIGEAFGRFLARGKPGYVGRDRLSPAEASEVIIAAGGLPVLAHPAKIGPRAAIEEILDQGMRGVEVYHSDHNDVNSQMLLALAKERGLVVTGGTDSHGPLADRPLVIGNLDIPDWVGEQFLQHAPKAWSEAR